MAVESIYYILQKSACFAPHWNVFGALTSGMQYFRRMNYLNCFKYSLSQRSYKYKLGIGKWCFSYWVPWYFSFEWSIYGTIFTSMSTKSQIPIE